MLEKQTNNVYKTRIFSFAQVQQKCHHQKERVRIWTKVIYLYESNVIVFFKVILCLTRSSLLRHMYWYSINVSKLSYKWAFVNFPQF